jgi:hypothetical protein
VPSGQYILAQQPPFYQPPREFYQQAEPPPVVTQNVQTTLPPVDPPYLVQINRTNFVPPEFPGPPFTGPPLASDGHPILVSYQELQFKSAPRILNQAEGTDWTFLGVG